MRGGAGSRPDRPRHYNTSSLSSHSKTGGKAKRETNRREGGATGSSSPRAEAAIGGGVHELHSQPVHVCEERWRGGREEKESMQAYDLIYQIESPPSALRPAQPTTGGGRCGGEGGGRGGVRRKQHKGGGGDGQRRLAKGTACVFGQAVQAVGSEWLARPVLLCVVGVWGRQADATGGNGAGRGGTNGRCLYGIFGLGGRAAPFFPNKPVAVRVHCPFFAGAHEKRRGGGTNEREAGARGFCWEGGRETGSRHDLGAGGRWGGRAREGEETA